MRAIKKLRPALRYFGGKWRLAPWIIDNLPPHKVYVEPYGGAASVLLRKSRVYAEIYNDLDGEIVNLFRILRNRETAIDLEYKLSHTPFSRAEFLEAYEASDCNIEQARRTIIKSFMGFGPDSIQSKSGFRSNSNRSGTTPAHDWLNYPPNISLLSERMKGVVIEQKPAIDVMNTHDSVDTLHFVDPPYVHGTRSRSTVHCYRYEMTDEQHSELSTTLHSLNGMIVLCGYPSEIYTSLYSDWKRIDKAAHADGARKRTECLWLNAAAADHISQLDLLEAV